MSKIVGHEISTLRFGLPFLLSLTVILVRVLTYHEPLERDIAIYAVVAHSMLEGRPLYSEMWDLKPPGVYLIYAGAELLAGYGKGQIFLLGVSAAIVTLIGIYRAVLEATDDANAGLWAAFFWLLVGSDIDLLANQPNSEVFMNAAVVWGLAFFLRARKRAFQSSWLLLAAGSLWAIASFVKQVAFMIPLLLGVYYLFNSSGDSWKARLLKLSALWCPIILLWGTTCAYFAATGRWDILIFTLVTYGRTYVSGSNEVVKSVSPWVLAVPRELFVLGPIVLLTWMCLLITRRRLSATWVLVLAVAVATQVAISIPGYYHMHYYQLWLPVICWAGGLAVAQIRGSAVHSAAPWLAGAVALALVALQWPKWRLPVDQISVRKYGSTLFVDMEKIAPRLDTLLKPHETLYQYGFDPEFYFLTQRRPPVGTQIGGSPHLPLPDWIQQRTLLSLEKTKPDLALFDTIFVPTRVTQYPFQKYVPLPKRNNQSLLLMVRRGSNLEKRIKRMPRQIWP